MCCCVSVVSAYMTKDQQVTRTRTREQNTRQQNKPLTRTQSEQSAYMRSCVQVSLQMLPSGQLSPLACACCVVVCICGVC